MFSSGLADFGIFEILWISRCSKSLSDNTTGIRCRNWLYLVLKESCSCNISIPWLIGAVHNRGIFWIIRYEVLQFNGIGWNNFISYFEAGSRDPGMAALIASQALLYHPISTFAASKKEKNIFCLMYSSLK